ncbi:MAG: type I restriction enzyme HsdR N-terminal domain-containing protein [Chloroflexi bacterium]|nr:type I restriction enzyme HsdR N-terminal domain-containing protein [Chloroflexota bacterium]
MIQELQAEVSRVQEQLRLGRLRNEAEIRQGVVIPFLATLGWPQADVRVVTPEFSIGKRNVDYALCHPQDRPAVLVEVKDVGKADEKGEKQLFEYCFHQGVPVAVLTDGATWKFFHPAGQGSYGERQFALVDLMRNAPSAESSETLVRYLAYEDVIAGRALSFAQEDYEQIRLRRLAESELGRVWQQLLEEPDSVLVDLLSEGVAVVSRAKPEKKSVVDFLRGQVYRGESHLPDSGSTRKARVQSRGVKLKSPGDSGSSTSFSLAGQTTECKNPTELFVAVFEALARRDPKFCERYAAAYSGRKNKVLARKRVELIPSSLERARRSARRVPGGWWLRTHSSTAEKEKRIRQACNVAGIEYGRDLVVRFSARRNRS